MANGIRTGDPRGFNKERSSKFREGSRVRKAPEEGRRTYRPKRCGNSNKDGDNSPKTLNDKKFDTSLNKESEIVIIFLLNVFAMSWKIQLNHHFFFDDTVFKKYI